VTVRLRYDDDGVDVVIEDDGAGVAATHAMDGHGLVGMRERVGAAGGRLMAAPRFDGPGWRVEARVPMGARR
jgi:signal transduction histidine kinase